MIESKVLYRMSFFVFVFYLTTMLLQFGDREMLSIWINVFTYAPLLIALSWFPRVKRNKGRKEKKKREKERKEEKGTERK